jgi:hypothetical protein
MSKYFELEYSAPYKGIDTETPPILLDPSASPSMLNCWLRNKEIRSAPPFTRILSGPEKNNAQLGQSSFLDANNQNHTCSFTSRGLWQLRANNGIPGQNDWVFVGAPFLATAVPVSSRSFANVLYYTNGMPYVLSWDGIELNPQVASQLNSSTFGGAGSSVGGLFLYEINDQICILNCSLFNVAQITNPISGTGPTTLLADSVTQFPQLLWYSANGLPNVWDPTVNISAGFVNFLDVPDSFTGVMAFGEVAYLFRNNGITYQTITGSTALAPFYFDHMWSSEYGVGCVYPWSIAQYGSVGFFVSTEDIYKIGVEAFEAVGGGARDAIMADLANAIGYPVAGVISSYAYGYIYLRYELCIPIQGSTKIWSYSLDDKNWMPQMYSQVQILGRPSVCWR